MAKLTHDYAIRNLRVLARNLGGPVRRHAPQHQHAPIDAYVGFIEQLLQFTLEREAQMSSISQALTKVETQRDAWKTYAQNQKTLADQATRAQKAAEDKLAALPLLPDADDAANVNGVLNAADDLPPTDTTTTPTTPTGDTGTPTTPPTDANATPAV